MYYPLHFFTLSVCTRSSGALEAALLLVRRNSKLLIEHNLELAAAPTTSFLLEAVSLLSYWSSPTVRQLRTRSYELACVRQHLCTDSSCGFDCTVHSLRWALLSELSQGVELSLGVSHRLG